MFFLLELEVHKLWLRILCVRAESLMEIAKNAAMYTHSACLLDTLFGDVWFVACGAETMLLRCQICFNLLSGLYVHDFLLSCELLFESVHIVIYSGFGTVLLI